MSSTETCYLCGATVDLTDDHIPPESFYPPPRPDNLFKVRACRTCNEGFSLDDEAFRILASCGNGSPEGAWIWEHKVIGSSFKRSKKLEDNVVDHIVDIPGETNDRGVADSLPAMRIPYDRVNPFMVRIAKGFLRFFYPKFDYGAVTLKPRLIDPSDASLPFLETILPTLQADERGAGVFRVWHGFTPTGNGVFFFLFYNHMLFFVPIIANQGTLKSNVK